MHHRGFLLKIIWRSFPSTANSGHWPCFLCRNQKFLCCFNFVRLQLNSCFPTSCAWYNHILLCSLSMKMGAKSTTITGLSGTGDIMLTCFVNLSRNRTVGVRLGSGENLDDILRSMNQVLGISPLTPFPFFAASKKKKNLLSLVWWSLTGSNYVGGGRCIDCRSCDCFGTKIQRKNASFDSSCTDHRQWTDPSKSCSWTDEPASGHSYIPCSFLFIHLVKIIMCKWS